MRCPQCNSENVTCVDSRPWQENKHRRRRECADCGERFSTAEIPMKEYDILVYRIGKAASAIRDAVEELELQKGE